jgi:CBS domain-containing protein
MTADPITASESDSADEAIRTMLDNGFRHLPVVAAGRTVGVVSLRELMRAALQVDA